MTHFYLYIKAGQTLDTDTRFYKVGIGESEIQRKKLAWIEAYAFEHGHFFVRWSLDAVNFLVKCQKSIGADQYGVIAVMAVDLVRILRDNAPEPSSYQVNLNRHRLLMQIDPDYYCCQQIKSKSKVLGETV